MRGKWEKNTFFLLWVSWFQTLTVQSWAALIILKEKSLSFFQNSKSFNEIFPHSTSLDARHPHCSSSLHTALPHSTLLFLIPHCSASTPTSFFFTSFHFFSFHLTYKGHDVMLINRGKNEQQETVCSCPR